MLAAVVETLYFGVSRRLRRGRRTRQNGATNAYVPERVQMGVEAANRAIKDGSLPKIVQGFTEAAKPEGVWFTALDGKRTMVAVFDLASTAQIPPLAEPRSSRG